MKTLHYEDNADYRFKAQDDDQNNRQTNDPLNDAKYLHAKDQTHEQLTYTMVYLPMKFNALLFLLTKIGLNYESALCFSEGEHTSHHAYLYKVLHEATSSTPKDGTLRPSGPTSTH